MIYQLKTAARNTGAVCLLVVILLLSGCGSLLQPEPVDLTGDPLGVGENVWFYDLDGQDTSSGVGASIDLGNEPKDVYIVFSNPTGSFANAGSISVTTPRSASTADNSTIDTEPDAPTPDLSKEDTHEPGTTDAHDWQPPALSTTPASRGMSGDSSRAVAAAGSHSIGDSAEFFDDRDTSNPVRATLARRIDDSSGPSGTTVEIWVETSEYRSTSSSGTVTAQMVSELGDTFLKPGSADDDIYDWVTSIFGDEWGDTPYNNLIPNRNTVTILIHNMENNGPGGTVGYYWSKDAFINESVNFSNERIMFYLDSESFDTRSGSTWEITDRWPAIIVSTLAHEFQHMIHFYQRYVKRGATSETWLNEMMSLVTEDFVARKLGIEGPRGVDPLMYADGSAGNAANGSGRLPRYNRANDQSLTEWGASGSTLDSYSLAYSFGAYLARNFGGVELFQGMMTSSSSNSERVVQEALSLQGYSNGTLEELLWRWGVSTLRSEQGADEPFQLNPGMWMASGDFSLGSINHFNYYGDGGYGPAVHDASEGSIELKPYSKAIYHAGSGLTGQFDVSMLVSSGVDFAIVAN